MLRRVLALILTLALLGGVRILPAAPPALAPTAYAAPAPSATNPVGYVTLEEFGGVANSSSIDNTPALNAAIDYIVAHRNETASRLYLPAVGTYWFKSRPNDMRGTTIIGAGMSATGMRMSFDSTAPALRWIGDGAGGGLEDIAVTVDDGHHIQNAIHLKTGPNGELCAFQRFRNVWISYTGSGSWGETVWLYGPPQTWGIRDTHWENVYVFGGTQDAIWINDAKNLYWTGGGTYRGAYNGSVYLVGTGPDFSQQSASVIFSGSVDGNLSVNYSRDVLWMGVVANSYSQTNSSNVKFILTKN